jgi:two-component system OmpR family sensor kinase
VKFWSQRPLRVQLAALTVGFVAVALLVSGTIAVGLLRSYLVDQVDTALIQSASNPQLSQRGTSNSRPAPRLPSDLYLAYLSADGEVQRTLSARDDDDDDDGPALPTLTSAQVQEQARVPMTVPSVEDNEGPWRVVYTPQFNGSLAVARSLDEVQTITQRLILVMVAVGVVVVVGVGVLATWWQPPATNSEPH